MDERKDEHLYMCQSALYMEKISKKLLSVIYKKCVTKVFNCIRSVAGSVQFQLQLCNSGCKHAFLVKKSIQPNAIFPSSR